MFERASAPKRIVFHRFSRKGQRALRPAARVCNALLPVTGAALFAWGCGAALALRTPLEEALPGPVTLLAGFLAFDMLHECGHMTANCACGCPVEEIGLLLEPDMAFYVRNNSGPIVSARGRRQYLQICLAGIETDLAAIGVLLWSCARTGSRTCAFFALFNMISVVHNALPVSGRDGEKALSALLHVEDVDALAQAVLASPARRRALVRRGIHGRRALRLLWAIRLARGIDLVVQGIGMVGIRILLL